jgi:hypothetical protein
LETVIKISLSDNCKACAPLAMFGARCVPEPSRPWQPLQFFAKTCLPGDDSRDPALRDWERIVAWPSSPAEIANARSVRVSLMNVGGKQL